MTFCASQGRLQTFLDDKTACDDHPEGACHHVVTTRRGTARRRLLAGGRFFGYFDYPNPNFEAFPVFFCLIMLLEICSQLKYWDWPLTFELTLE